MKEYTKYGILNAIVGLAIGIFITCYSIGNGYWIFVLGAPLAAFLSGSIIWKYFLKNDNTISKPIIVGLLTGSISHYLCWIILGIGQNICYWTTGGCTSSLGDPPISIFSVFGYGIGTTIISLIMFGWITILSSIGIGLYMRKDFIKRKNEIETR